MSLQKKGKSNHIVIYGRDHESASEIHRRTIENSNIAFGISVGIMSKANEDCLGISKSGDEALLAIADGHWGREASELAIDKTMEMFRLMLRPAKENEIRARFYALFEQINQELFSIAMSHPGAIAPETTLIVCQLKEIRLEKYLYWSGFGDSYLFVFRNNKLTQLNSLNQYWLGMLSRMSEYSAARQLTLKSLFGESRYIGVADGLETGIEKLQSGDIIILCTDGLIGSDERVPESVGELIRTILTSVDSLENKVSNLIKSALDRGERDNISCILAQIE
jgi:serine/threonine protein phosphatase PrpC